MIFDLSYTLIDVTVTPAVASIGTRTSSSKLNQALNLQHLQLTISVVILVLGGALVLLLLYDISFVTYLL